ncbi:MAG: DUF4339 domain-containing protein, partial [Planctomycetota bacterium]
MSVQWFVKTQAGQAGPFSSQQLKQLVVDGKVKPETGVRRETDEKWFLAKQFKGMFDQPSAPPQVAAAKKLPPVKTPHQVKVSGTNGTVACCVRSYGDVLPS